MSETAEDQVVSGPALFAGMLTKAQLGAQTRWGDRTIARNEVKGLPVIVIGATRLYPVDKVREWMLAQIRERKEPTRGRPRKAA